MPSSNDFAQRSASAYVFLLARVHLFILALAFTLLGLDPFLLQTDVRSLLGVTAGVLFLLTGLSALLAAVVLLLLRVLRRPELAARLCQSSPFTVLFAAAVTIAADPFLVKADRQELLLAVFPAAALVGYLVERRSPARLPRIDRLALVTLLVSATALPLAQLARAATRTRPAEGPALALPPGKRGLVVVVIDGLGERYISALNPKSPITTPNLDGFIKESVSFTNAYTNFPYTVGAFSAIYSGREEAQNRMPARNLLATLQEHGIRTRLLVSHPNAIPENKCFRYRGVRSLYLSQYYTFVPRWLGLDYHVLVHTPPKKTDVKVPGRHKLRLAPILALLNAGFPSKGPLKTALAELDNLSREERPFFLLLHLFPHSVSRLPKPTDLDLGKTPEDRKAAEARMHAMDYHYDAADSWRVDELRDTYLKTIKAFDAAFGEFMGRLCQRPWAGSVDVLLTADHGSIYEDGKVWYGYHVDEPVLRVPLVIWTGGPARTEAGLRQTVDIPATVMDWFGLDVRSLSPDGHSLLNEPAEQQVLSFTGRRRGGSSEAAVYAGGDKHVFEIDTQNRPQWRYSERLLPSGGTDPIADPPESVAQLTELLTSWCKDRRYTR